MEFCLFVKYETGECAYVTDTPDLQEALSEFISKLESERADQNFKSYAIPRIVEAKLVKIVK